MRGLLVKDLYNFIRNSKSIVFIILFYIIYSISFKNLSMLYAMLGVVALILTLNSYAYDEKANWQKVALTMPISRKELAISKYIFAIIVILSTLLINICVSVTMRMGINKEDMVAILTMTCLYTIYIAFILPLLYWLGSQSARYFMLILVAIPTILYMIGIPEDFLEQLEKNINIVMIIIPVVTIVLYLISMYIGMYICEHKEYS